MVGPAANWEQGDAYERYMGRWSRRIAPRFLAWLDAPADRRWLDVGCGTGAVCGAILEHCSPAAVTGVDPSEGFLAAARESLAGRATLLRGSATALPLEDGAFDATVVIVSLAAQQESPRPPDEDGAFRFTSGVELINVTTTVSDAP